MGESGSFKKNNDSKESMKTADFNKCPLCGGSVARGHLQSPGHGYPRVFLSLEKNHPEESVAYDVSAFVCLDCGHISLKGYLENIST